jgi:hypothetical protein
MKTLLKLLLTMIFCIGLINSALAAYYTPTYMPVGTGANRYVIRTFQLKADGNYHVNAIILFLPGAFTQTRPNEYIRTEKDADRNNGKIISLTFYDMNGNHIAQDAIQANPVKYSGVFYHDMTIDQLLQNAKLDAIKLFMSPEKIKVNHGFYTITWEDSTGERHSEGGRWEIGNARLAQPYSRLGTVTTSDGQEMATYNIFYRNPATDVEPATQPGGILQNPITNNNNNNNNNTPLNQSILNTIIYDMGSNVQLMQVTDNRLAPDFPIGSYIITYNSAYQLPPEVEQLIKDEYAQKNHGNIKIGYYNINKPGGEGTISLQTTGYTIVVVDDPNANPEKFVYFNFKLKYRFNNRNGKSIFVYKYKDVNLDIYYSRISISPNMDHILELTSQGVVECAGDNSKNQCGPSSLGKYLTKPVPISGIGPAKDIDAVNGGSLVLEQDSKTIDGLGDDINGTLGLPKQIIYPTPTPLDLEQLHLNSNEFINSFVSNDGDDKQVSVEIDQQSGQQTTKRYGAWGEYILPNEEITPPVAVTPPNTLDYLVTQDETFYKIFDPATHLYKIMGFGQFLIGAMIWYSYNSPHLFMEPDL